MKRLSLIALIVAAAIVLGQVGAAAQTFTRPVTVIVPTAGGGGPTDILARTLATGVSPLIGQQVIVENRPGAGSYLGGALVARSTPDGQTLLVNSFSGLHSDLFVKDQVSLARELIPVAGLAEGPFEVIVPASLPVTNLKEFVAYVRANPGKLNMAVFPNTVLYLDMVRFIRSAGLNMAEIPYNSSAAITAAIAAGEVHMYFSSISTPKPFIDSGRIRALAMTSAERFPLEPAVPTAREQGFDVVSSSFFAALAPLQTPAAVVKLLNQRIGEAMDSPDAREAIRRIGMSRMAGSPEQLSARLSEETASLKDTAVGVGIRPQ
jgi:tripartite-type tricarboxylate transporter receptor subunit TctC